MLKIDPELEALIPPLSSGELADLEAALLSAGRALDPIKHCGGVILDGHNRFRICTRLGLPYDTQAVALPDKAAIKAWMLQYQRGRRNMTPDQILALSLRHEQPPPAGFDKLQVQVMRDAIAAGKYDDVMSKRLTLRTLIQAHNRKLRPPTPPRATAPAAPRTVEVITAETRAKAQAAAAKADAKAIASRVTELEDALAFMHAAPCVPPVIKTPRSRPKSGMRPGTPQFVLSDLHFGETVTLAETLGVNEYDLDIAAERVAECFDNMLWLRRDMARTVQCDDTVLYLNGDIVSGDIHDELKETNDGGLRAQCDAAFASLLPGIRAFADATPGVLHVVCIGGNHGRLTHKQHIKNGTEHSAEHLGVYDPLRRVVGDMCGKVSWHIPKAERYILSIHERRVAVQHGTMIKSQGGIGGTLVPMTRWVTRTNDADHYIFGHFHEADAYGKIIKNGATIGASAYTKWLGIEDRPPEQVGFIIDPRHGVRRFERVSVT